MNGAAATTLLRPCASSDQLWNWIDRHLDLRIPRIPVCPNHQAPFDYLAATYHEPARDLVVWAPRSGGKTLLVAVATLLDLLHKPGCHVRLLGGTLPRALHIWDYLHPMLLDLAQNQITGRAFARRIDLANGSAAAVLTQSQCAVRGLSIQKLRCDEVEFSDPLIWQAAQLATRSNPARHHRHQLPSPPIRGVVEALSSVHVPFGLMRNIVDSAAQTGHRRIIHWCLLDILQACPPERQCSACPLWDDCLGVAKSRCHGFLSIDQAIALKHSLSAEAWHVEMLCRHPRTTLSVFPSFNPAIHVREAAPSLAPARLSASIDFGFHCYVCLWVRAFDDGVVHIIDERVEHRRPLPEHIAHLQARPWGDFADITCDPAGNAANAQTTTSDIDLLRAAGFTVFCRPSRIADGLKRIRAALHPAAGPVRLFIHPRCQSLITAMQSYRYRTPQDPTPHKDGIHDHPIDALRYHYINQQPPTNN